MKFCWVLTTQIFILFFGQKTFSVMMGNKEARMTINIEELSNGQNQDTKNSSFFGLFLKLLTRGFLKKIALPAIVRTSITEDYEKAMRIEKLNKITRVQ